MASDPAGNNDDPDRGQLDDLGRRIGAKRDQSPEAKPAPPGRLNVVYRLSTEFVAAVFVGMALGWAFDYVTGLNPFGKIAFSILGIATAFYMVFRAARQLAAEQEKKDK